MRFSEIFSTGRPVLSFEFFPPKDISALSATFELIRDLAKLAPDFMTVTYGAAGGTRDATAQITKFIREELKLPAVQHLTCAGHSVAEIDAIVAQMQNDGVMNVLALRGDPPKGESHFVPHPEGFSSARDLTRHLVKHSELSIAVAGYPETHKEAVSREADLKYLKEKVDAGAELIITQLFFDASFYFSFVDSLRRLGVNVPVLPGVMPIGNVNQVKRFTELCGASIPTDLLEKLNSLGDDAAAVTQFGIKQCIELCHELLAGGAPGLHLYTLNKSRQVKVIVESLNGALLKG